MSVTSAILSVVFWYVEVHSLFVMIFLCVNIRYILFLLLTVALFIFIFSQSLRV